MFLFQPPRKIRSMSEPNNFEDILEKQQVICFDLTVCIKEAITVFVYLRTGGHVYVGYICNTYILLSNWLAERRCCQKTCIRACESIIWYSKTHLETKTSRAAIVSILIIVPLIFLTYQLIIVIESKQPDFYLLSALLCATKIQIILENQNNFNLLFQH